MNQRAMPCKIANAQEHRKGLARGGGVPELVERVQFRVLGCLNKEWGRFGDGHGGSGLKNSLSSRKGLRIVLLIN